MSDKYHRLVTFVVSICPRPLRELLINKAKECTGVLYTTLDAYLQTRKSFVNNLKRKGIICINQYEMIYPTTGVIDVNNWDVTLLVALLKSLFNLSKSETSYIDHILDTRNKLQHIASCTSLDDEVFNKYWSDLEHSVKSLATCTGGGSLSNLSDDMSEAKNGNMPNLGDVLRTWYLELTVESRKQVLGLEDKMEQLQVNNDQLRKENDLLQGKVDRLQYNNNQLQNKYDAIQEQKAQLQTIVEQLQNTIDCQKKQMDAVKAERTADKRIEVVDHKVEKMRGFERMPSILDDGPSQDYGSKSHSPIIGEND